MSSNWVMATTPNFVLLGLRCILTIGKFAHRADPCFSHQVINAILRLSHLLVCVNSSANFLIYYARGEKFRMAWIHTFGAWWCCCCSTPGHRQSQPPLAPALPENPINTRFNSSCNGRRTSHENPRSHEVIVELHPLQGNHYQSTNV